jgi:hypothetical protein
MEEKTLREELQEIEALERLLANEDFQVLQEIVKKQIETRTQAVLVPVETPGGVMVQEYMKGAIEGLRLLLETPSRRVEDKKTILAELREGDFSRAE